MYSSEIITSLQNPKVKAAAKLWKRSERDSSGCFIIEGYRELSRAALSQIEINTLFICKELFLGSNEEMLIQQILHLGATVLPCSAAVFKKLSYRDRPDGLLAVAVQRHRSIVDLKPTALPFYLVAEGIEKPGNLGTMLRSADAVQVDAMIVCDQCTDIHNPNVVRASVGTLFTVPVIEGEGEEIFQWLHSQGIAIIAATPAAERTYTQVDFRGPVALVVGTEQYGLSKRWMEGADIQVKLPMLGAADSLNVAMAATLLLYEVLRQRV